MGEQRQWLSAAEVMEKYGVSKSALYGSIAKRVRVMRLPGSSMKWNRYDLDVLCRQSITLPEVPPAVVHQQPCRRVLPPPAARIHHRFLTLAFR